MYHKIKVETRAECHCIQLRLKKNKNSAIEILNVTPDFEFLFFLKKKLNQLLKLSVQLYEFGGFTIQIHIYGR